MNKFAILPFLYAFSMTKKKGNFDDSIIELNPRQSQPLVDDEMVPIDTDNDESKWSWNPIDWFHGIKDEIIHFNLTMTPRRRVVSTIK